MSAEMKVSVLVKGRALLGRGFRIGRGPDSRLYQNAKSSLGAEKDRPVVGQGRTDSGFGNDRADLARKLLPARRRRLGIKRGFAELPRGRAGKALDLADQMRLVVKGVAKLRLVQRLADRP